MEFLLSNGLESSIKDTVRIEIIVLISVKYLPSTASRLTEHDVPV